MSLKDIELENSISRISQLEAILSLTLLKQEHPRENVEEITELLKSASLSLFSESPSQIELDATSKLNKIKNRLFTEKIEKEKKFDFEIKTLALQSFLDDINGLNLNISDYLMSFGNSNVCYINKVWLNGSSEFKKENLNLKYVKIGDRSIERVGFTVANSFTYGIQMELKKCISYLDSDKKILHWENIISDLKSLSKSSGYTEGDVRLALMGLLRLGGLNQDLYSDMNINEIAQSLIDSVKPIHKSTILWGALRKLKREVNTPLQLILAEAESYIRKIFPAPEQRKTRENYHFVALTSFINDNLSLEVINDVKRKKELNKEYNYETYKDMLIRLEHNELNIPTEILKYGRKTKNQNCIQEDTLYNTVFHNIHNNTLETDSYDSIFEEENTDCSNFFAEEGRINYNTYSKTEDRSSSLDRRENRHGPNNNTYNKNRNEQDNTKRDSRPQDRYKSSHGNNYDRDNESRSTNRRRSPDFTSHRDISGSETNKYRTVDGYYTKHFSRDQCSEIREDYPRFRPGHNCREDYNPYNYKFCRKCNLEKHYGHHEFDCKYFESFNVSNCKRCRNGFHFVQDCDLDYEKNGQLG